MSLFTGAIATALALGASTAGQLVSAHMNSNAAENSTKAQTDAADKALAYTQGQKAKQEAAWAPYAALSANAVGQLPGATRGPAGPPPPSFGAAYQPPQGQPQRGSTLMNMGSMQPPMPMAGGGAGVPQPPQQGAQMVMLQAPDGSQKSVPANQAQFYISRGAKQVGI